MQLRKHVVRTPADRVRLIEQQVRQSVYTSEVGWLRAWAVQRVLAGTSARDDRAALDAVFHWVRDNIRYEPDPIRMDLYPTARGVVAMRTGDCDCHTILVCSLAAVIGFEVGCRVIEDAERGWHVYALVGMPRNNPTLFVPVDTAWGEASGVGDEFPLHHDVTDNQTWLFELEG